MKRGAFAGMFAALVGAPLVTLSPKQQQKQAEIDELFGNADEMDVLSWDRMGVCQSIRLGFPDHTSKIVARQKDLTWKIIG